MNLPFTTEQFIDVFKSYNLSVWPAQIFLLLLALAAILHSVIKTKFSDTVISLTLIFYWLWIGIVYHYIFFTIINPAAYIFSAFFVVQAILFFYFAFVKHPLRFRYKNNLKGLTALILFLYALIVYPLLGYSLGHYYPGMPTFGLPCPTTIFTFGLLLLVEGRMPKILLFIPVLWSVIGFTAAIKFGILQDIGLLASAITTIVIIWTKKDSS